MSDLDHIKFHDGELVSISFEKNAINLVFCLVDLTHVVVELHGVLRFLCDHLREGNVVLEVAEVHEASLCNRLLVKLLGLDLDAGEPETPYVLAIKDKIRRHELSLFHVAPSYGCDLVALCEKVVCSVLDSHP